MKQSKLFLNTLRENPADADVASHRLMLRAGLMRQLTAGVYTFLPLGYRVLSKIEAIVRQEMDNAGAQEVLLPAMQPAELWQQSGRWEDYGAELIRFQDRHDRTMVLGPTHEEVITSLVQNEVQSYRQLPVTLYQIQTKFRDEPRPRAGLLRGREFRMKDAYSFDLDEAGLDASYQAMYDAYCRIFDRLGVEYRAVEADSGAIGGEAGNHEFMVLSEAGEDTIAGCSHCSYAANVEKAVGQALPQADASQTPAREKVATPGTKTIEDLVRVLGVSASQIIKVVVYLADGKPVAACLRGDHEVNEVKLKKVLGAKDLTMASAEEVLRETGKPVGFVGPDCGLKVVFDRDILSIADGVAASNEAGYHDIHVVPNRDFPVPETADIRMAAAGDLCVKCGQPLRLFRGIEVGHVFKLGTKYSKAFGATYTDESGAERTIIMGCYGLGTSRVIPAVIEQCHDENGIIWPIAIAPYHVHIVPVNIKDEQQVKAAESLYHRLHAAGVEVLLDDRDERPGVKFKDADLIGLPVRVTIGSKIAEGNVELKIRRTGEVQVLTVEQAFETILGIVK
ncbi:proline--tRNA ligase [Alicyclobacillus cycloheptanicus]|uniref:Proline--tRNA ligase n=1 Tax=Alicyclobacillus cycloheptanicus TaxID=1457 RepID=A0ABT9XJS2_9BACL|nr:proline--tRNA ligase [Alicyclobacillus cycloheptanicus]MDQ0190528.1 prolyl-tRNA synthetase [Alicyclobacillus cycloheptanicus]WDM01371.1 proline--tRNA ligase [Alicyclobacillus cycloheptanicus]